ncbi:MAG: lysophospholipid acyltransferase family protein [Desulfobulbaceae bacterium]|jgi:lysophospholipid acyltransferase (LPLAT)-like uncharacterized protein|nr:lysophospholipid acyltransferase family protein [Desulfobulbaceae bacterium]
MKDRGLVYELSIRAVPWLLYWLLRLLFATCRLSDHGAERLTTAIANGTPVIGSFWHYSLLLVLYRVRGYSCVAMVSASRDGEYMARLLKRFGVDAARGSRNRGGVAALKELISNAVAGRHCAVVADGSQGPELRAQPGTVLLASRSGGSIVPIVCAASRYWCIQSWDRTIIPKPFSRIEVYFGETITVPAEVDGPAVERFRLTLEKRLLSLYQTAWSNEGKERH